MEHAWNVQCHTQSLVTFTSILEVSPGAHSNIREPCMLAREPSRMIVLGLGLGLALRARATACLKFVSTHIWALTFSVMGLGMRI